MKKKFLTGLVTGLFLFGLAGATNATTIFSETFDNNDNGWRTDSYWQVTDGVYNFTSSTDFYSWNNSFLNKKILGSTDFTGNTVSISYDFKFNAPWVGFQTAIGFFDDSNYGYTIRSSKEYKSIALQQGVYGSNDLTTYLNGLGGVVYSYDQWHNANMTISDGAYQMFLDDSLMFVGSFASLEIDQIGFRIWRSNGSYDNLLVDVTPNTAPVPEPATMLLFGTGVAGLAGSRLKRRKKA